MGSVGHNVKDTCGECVTRYVCVYFSVTRWSAHKCIQWCVAALDPEHWNENMNYESYVNSGATMPTTRNNRSFQCLCNGSFKMLCVMYAMPPVWSSLSLSLWGGSYISHRSCVDCSIHQLFIVCLCPAASICIILHEFDLFWPLSAPIG